MTHHLSSLKHEVVRASAGAGKTYQLTTRYLALMGRREPVRNILATTFTRKAAGEVLERVLGRLADACLDEAKRAELSVALGLRLGEDHCARMLRELADSLGRLAVGTIDGFFNRAARAMALELGLPPDPRLIDEGSPIAKQMRMDAIHAVLGEQAAGDGMQTLIELLRRLHHDSARSGVAEAIDQIVVALDDVYRAHQDRALWDALPDAGGLSTDLLTAAIEQIQSMQPQIPRNAKGKVYTNFEDRIRDLINDSHAKQWGSVLGNGLVGKVDEGAEKYGHAPIGQDWHQAIKPLLLHAKAHQVKALADQTLATYDLVRLYHEKYKAMRRAKRVLLFSDLTHLLADGLAGRGGVGIDELCYRLDAQVTHLLLDEFQDTSLRQWEVIEPFAEQITDNLDDGRSLFCVGDTKQAIYGWRGGCAELFEKVQALPDVRERTLSKSWRSSPVVLNTVNQVFGTLSTNAALEKDRDAASRWQQGFEDHFAEHEALPGHVVLRTTAAGQASANLDVVDDDDASTPPDAHAHAAAGYIRELNETMPSKSIGVLMRSRAKAHVLMHALREIGVDAAEEGGQPIANTPAVAAVLSAVRLADHPGDTVSRFHITNSPMGAVLGLASNACDADVQGLSRQTRRALMDHGYAKVIARWAEALAPSCDTRSLRRLEQLVELAQGFDEHDAGLRPAFFIDAVASARVEDLSPAPVRVMTIHASKGLEFDAVVLADLDATLGSSDAKEQVVYLRESPIAPVRAIYRRVRGTGQLLPEIQEAWERQAFDKRTEDLCLLYVAMTRARQGLHMLVRPLKQGSKKGKPSGAPTSAGLTNLSYAAILRQALRVNDKEGFEGSETLYEAGAPPWPSDRIQKQDLDPSDGTQRVRARSIQFTKTDPLKARSWLATTPSAMHAQGTVSVDDLLRRSPRGGRAYGTAMHALFEHVGFIDEGLPDASAMQAVLNALPHQDEFDRRALLGRFESAINQPEVVQLLSRHGADKLWRERPFVIQQENRLVQGTFDRVHLWRQGGVATRALLIDFKTDRADDEAASKLVEKYADQLRLYRKALSSLLHLDEAAIDCRLCFVGDGRVATVSA